MIQRLPMLARLATRYARRHRGQTVRAVLGLVVVSVVLTTGLGLGDSLRASLEEGIEERYGPVHIVGRGPAQASMADIEAALAASGVSGVPSLSIIGSVSNPERGRAEAFASLRGADARESSVLGPLPNASEPVGDGIVLSQALADRLLAQVGDHLVIRAVPPDLNETFGITTIEVNATVSANGTYVESFQVEPDALGILASVRGNLTILLVAPDGREYPPIDSGREVRALAPITPGTWRFEAQGDPGARVEAVVRTGGEPPDIADFVIQFNATVTAIVPTEGRAAISFRPGAILPLARLQDVLDLQEEANQLLASSADAPAAAQRLEGILGNETWNVQATKEEALERIRRDAGNLSGFILVMGGFTIVASMLLAYVLFSALVEERRVELGIARAVGLTRREVATTMVFEALVYAVLAAVIGLLVGIGLVQGLVWLVNDYAQRFNAPGFFLHFAPGTLATAFLGGVALPLLTIAAGTLRFARLDPSRAIRGAPEDVRVHRRAAVLSGLVVAALGLAATFDVHARLVGVGLFAGGIAVILLAYRRRVLAAMSSVAGIAYTLWSLYSFDAFPQDQRELDPVLTMGRALVVTLLAALLVASSPRPVRAAAAAFMRVQRLRRGAYLAFRYLASRRVQAGLTAATVAVVAVIVTVMGTLAAIFAGSLARDEGGYAVVGQSPFPLTTFPVPLANEDADAIERSEFLPQHRPLGDLRMTADGRPFRENRFVRFAGTSPGFAESNGYKVLDRDGRYDSDREAWRAVADGTALLAPPWYFDDEGLRVGGDLRIRLGGEERVYHVAGKLPDARRGDIFLAYDDVRGMGFPQTATVLVRLTPTADDSAIAHRLTEQYQQYGLAFESVAEEVREAEDVLQATVLVLQAFLFLGVLVGLSSTGFLAARAVHERRRDIGTLRSLGYEGPDVARAFLLESSIVAAVGLVLGVGVGLVVANSIWWRSVRNFGGEFVFPWVTIALFAAAVLALTMLASWRPSRRASKLDPAEALRYVE